MTEQVKYMSRAIDLAKNGLGTTSPNPMVGCVVVHNDKIIGEGWHAEYGGAHAEVNAINSVKDKSLLKKSTVYVTLEPCSHFGKTPPCTDLLIKNKVKEVVVAITDPNPLVSGKGLKKLQEHGIKVKSGLLEVEAEKLNIRFFTTHNLNRPYIILKWAETADGYIARENYDSKWISNKYSRKLVHKWRSEEDAILVGKKTVEMDNPILNVRNWEGKNPVRVVIDRLNLLGKDYRVMDGSIPTLVYNLKEQHSDGEVNYRQMKGSSSFLKEMLEDLKAEGINSVFVEGGSKMISKFIQEGFWDEARVFYSEKEFGKGIKAPDLDKEAKETRKLFDDTLKVYFNSTWQKN